MTRGGSRIGKRGMTGIEIVIIGLIATLGLVMSVVVPIFYLKVHLVRVLEFQYEFDNAGMTLLTFLSDDGIYRNLSLYVSGFSDNVNQSFNRTEVETIIKSRLDNLVTSQCYELSHSGGIIVSGLRCDTKYGASTHIVLPNGSREEITLEISSDMTTVSSPGPGPRPPLERTEYCCYNPLTGESVCETQRRCIDMGWEPEHALVAECSDPVVDCGLR